MATKLRKYQKEDLKLTLDYLEKGKNTIYQLPTGGGKSVIISEVVHEYRDKNVLVIAHRRELLLQMEDRLASDHVTPGLLIGEVERNIDSNILIGSLMTLIREKRMETVLNKKWDLVIVDEAHHLRTPSYDKLLDFILGLNPEVKILGVSATPYRSDKKDFKQYIEVLIKGKSVKELVHEGYLTKFRTFVTKIGDIDKEVQKSDKDYNLTQLSKYMRKPIFLQHLADQYKERGEERQCLIYCVDNKHLRDVVHKFESEGYTSIKSITADTPNDEREQTIKDYKENKLKMIASIGTLTEGTDLPDTGCLIIARPTDSLVLFHQIFGRGMRPSKLYQDCIFLDCAGMTLKHGSVDSKREWSLEPSKDPKDPTKKSKIVAKRKDGSYTDDLEEIQAGDLIVEEMTTEEYLVLSDDAIERAEEYNKSINPRIQELFESAFNTIEEKLLKGVPGVILTDGRKKDSDRWRASDDKSLKFNSPTLKHAIFLDKRNNCLIPSYTKSLYGSTTDEEIEDYLRAQEIIGKLAKELLLKKDSYRQIIDKFDLQEEELEDSVIDVSEIKEKKKAFIIKQWEIKIKDLLSKAEDPTKVIFYMKKSGRLEGFRDIYGRFQAFKFNQGKLYSASDVTFFDVRNASDNTRKLWPQGTSSSVEKPKLFNCIFEDGQEIDIKSFPVED